MPVPLGLQPLSALNPTTGFISQMLVAESDGYDDQDLSRLLAAGVAISRDTSDTTSRGFHPTQPLATDLNIMDEGENIVIPYYTGDASDTKDAAGPTTIGGNVMFPAAGDGTELIYAGLTQTTAPVVTGAITATETTIVNDTDLSAAAVTVVNPGFDNPVRLKIVLTSPVAGDAASIEITGTCLDGSGNLTRTTVTEEITYESGVTGSTIITDVHFYDVTAVSHEGWTSGDMTITGIDESRTVRFNSQDNRLIRFWTTEVAKGLVLNVYTGVIPVGMNFTFNRGNAVVYDTQFTGRRAFLYQDLQERMGVAAKKTSAANLGLATTEVFVGWQCELTVNGVRMPVTEATFTMNQNLQPTGVVTGVPWEDVKPFRSVRNVTMDMTNLYDPANNFARIFRSNLTMANTRLTLKHRPFAGYPWEVSFVMPQVQITNLPDAETPEGLLTQSIRAKSFTSGIGLSVPDDLYIIANYSKYNPVREFTI